MGDHRLYFNNSGDNLNSDDASALERADYVKTLRSWISLD